MDIQDILFSDRATLGLKTAVLEYAHSRNLGAYTKVLVPTEANDDVNGSQHNSNGGNDFTYEDATDEDVAEASTLGFYEYFSGYGGCYTGHYYEGDGRYFDAIVLDPPAYAVEVSF